ncbi:MAG: winged helix-turn-helix transcriptional regulator [Actinobacteria bacterium]|nr:MAG: winged helix-turn-helix transcriptional regulator [Actinomycetota bacterium]
MEEAALRAIASPRRREILRLVWDRELSSGDIASHFDVSWPAISQNLRVLEGAELVRTRRCGTARLYRANRSRLGPLRAVLVKMWEADLDRLAELAEDEERSAST